MLPLNTPSQKEAERTCVSAALAAQTATTSPRLPLQQAAGVRQRGWMGSVQRDPTTRCCSFWGILGPQAGQTGIPSLTMPTPALPSALSVILMSEAWNEFLSLFIDAITNGVET